MESPDLWDRFAFGLDPHWVGISGRDQRFLDYILWSREIHLAVEFGTHCGLTAYLLAVSVNFNGGKVVTIDDHDGRPERVIRSWPSNAKFWCRDLLVREDARVVSLLSRATAATLLICDNGDKVKEVEMYARHLPSGAILLVHDYGSEAPAGKLQPLLDGLFVPCAHEFAEAFGRGIIYMTTSASSGTFTPREISC